MLTEQERNMIVQALEKNTLKVDSSLAKLNELDSNSIQLDRNITARMDRLETLIKSEGEKNRMALEAQDKYLKGILEIQDKRITDIGAVRNWFVGLLTALVGTIIAVAVRYFFFS